MDPIPKVKRNRARTPKRKTRNRRILIQNLNKGKARREARCAFQLIPYPSKFPINSRIYCLYADVVLMEHQDTIVSEASLFNNYKIYTDVQIVDRSGQKAIKIKTESKNIPRDDWKPVVNKFESSGSIQMKEWADMIRTFCEKYETAIKEFQKEQKEMTPQKVKEYTEMQIRTEKIRENIFKTFPCLEFKCELRDGEIQMTELSLSEKYLAEVGYSLEAFAMTVLSEGLPEITPLNSQGAISIAKLRLQRCLTLGKEEYQTREVESCVLTKSGYIKKVKLRSHYLTVYEKGVLGFVFLGSVVSKHKPELQSESLGEELKLSRDFVETMAEREEEANYFLSTYYDQKVEQKFTNLSKTCKIKEIKDSDCGDEI